MIDVSEDIVLIDGAVHGGFLLKVDLKSNTEIKLWKYA